MTTAPILYEPSVESPLQDEEQVHRALIDTMRSITETTSRDYGHAVRSVHAKSHGLMEGTLTIDAGLPPELAQGLFAEPGRYNVVMRLSTIPGDILEDAVSVPRGMAIKVLDVPGERLPESVGETTQNFVLAQGPTFAAPDAKGFLGNLKRLAGTTDKAPFAKHVLSAVMRGVEGVLEAVGGQSALLRTLGGTPPTHPLSDAYYSQVPLRFGDYVAKVALVPVSPNLTELTDTKIGLHDPDALRNVVTEVLIEQGGAWELRVQLNTDLETMPIEDATIAWDEKASPYRTVGRIVVEPQLAWSTERSRQIDDGMFFSPWHGLAAHRPLGSVNRARRQTYEMSADFRGRFNGCPIHEPRARETAES